ncbi:putative membrane protein [Catenuloplanes nepalensis]|uniref:Membrane protein n=1 Tax=Catenuloplanes nepalensis TaxID=587533 RepID=A0ABT9MKH2_9ACTN|nr:carotenoid biosynthesis protein [Catenuloplanes nepalensis]MDP9791920.1 putative membrane protein [Catenuloplanes nepalensis]
MITRWLPLAVLVLAQICYPLTGGDARTGLTVATVVLGFVISVGHAAVTRGARTAALLVVIAAGGGLLIEATGVATGFPFGGYDYSGQLGPKVLGVPVIIPLAWAWMTWPAWLSAGRVVSRTVPRVLLAGAGLAAWDLFLDPQMVAAGHWSWHDTSPALPGVPGIPVTNYLGWLMFAIVVATLLSATTDRTVGTADEPMYGLYLWTYGSSIMAHAVFLGLPASAVWGGVGMAVLAVPLAVTLLHDRRPASADSAVSDDPAVSGDPAGSQRRAGAARVTGPDAGTGDGARLRPRR